MRQLKAARGVTLVELMVTLALLSLMLLLAAPAMAEHLRNAKLREAGNTVVAALQFARHEAIKRNAPVRVGLNGAALLVTDASGTVLRQDALSDAVSAALLAADDSAVNPPTVTFGGSGRPLPFGSGFKVDLTLDSAACSDTLRCPRVMVRSGGAVRLCRARADC